jgi:phosphate uptake regulator
MEEEVKRIKRDIGAQEGNDSIIRRVIGSFLDGYTHIKLRSEKIFTGRQHGVIREILGSLYMMIIEYGARRKVLETLIDEARASVHSGVERMHIITSTMCRDTLQSLKDEDKELARSVISLERGVDQLMFLLIRSIRGAAVNPFIGKSA